MVCVSGAQRVGRIYGLSGLDGGGAVFKYEGAVRRAVVAAKSGSRRDILDTFGSLVAELGIDLTGDSAPNIVTWIPASSQGRRERGFDQGRQLAGVVSARLGVPAERLLLRRRTRRQVGRGRAERLTGPDLRAPINISGHILLIDDVITTGASMATAAKALRFSGASTVSGLSIAWAATAEEVAARRPDRKGREAMF